MNTIGPFIIWRVQKLPADIKFFAQNDYEFIEQRTDEFKNYDSSILALGFSPVGSSTLKDSHSDSYFRLYWNRELQVAAMVVTIKSNVEEMTYFEFNQSFNDESCLSVSNSSTPECYPKLKYKKAYRFPQILEVDELLAIHTKFSEVERKLLIPRDYDVENGFKEIEIGFRKESDALLDKGIVKPEIDSKGKRSLTLFGAFQLTYRAVPPGKKITAFFTELRAKNALRNV